ncbi:2-oxoglutarate/2-oxoacid ferredoxin oxidoreductase, alpha subunit (EC [Olavius algarvensis associated proteobacterium Delta 3]|nr:2-oxoglutarate/2-oxoacid ferredoxin oxidoreductase, alpha subunit (EC [Olavius algarvensis associated proteobacterium Delta 3]
MAMSFMEGNEAVAWGAFDAGCRFFAGYPITPATTIYNTMLRLLPPAGGICLQGEDEIASIGFCLGASMAGLKVMTATSGPGISLYSEQISFAIGGEIPIVIVDVQRLGPSTGSATRGADGDIQFLRWGNSGGLPVIVLAPSDVRDCYMLTREAFNLSETYRCPVFVASNKEIGMTRESIDVETVPSSRPLKRTASPDPDRFQPFAVRDDRTVPDFLPIGGPRVVRQTSSTHGTDGYITTDPGEISRILDRMTRKVAGAVGNFSLHEVDAQDDAGILIITYGITARAARVALDDLRTAGERVSLLVLKTLWPVPGRLIRKTAENIERVIVAEMNNGQYVREIERLLPQHTIDFVGRMDGTLISPEDIRETV